MFVCGPQFDREHFSEVFVDLKWFESKVGNKYLNEAAGLAAEEARGKDIRKSKVSIPKTRLLEGVLVSGGELTKLWRL